jgi:RHS repeat-associated protein
MSGFDVIRFCASFCRFLTNAGGGAGASESGASAIVRSDARLYRSVLAAGLAAAISGSSAVAQPASVNVDTPNTRSAVGQVLLRDAAGSFSAAELIESACASGGGRDPGCWSADGNPAAPQKALESTVVGILQQAGIPSVRYSATSALPLDFGPPPFSITMTDMVVPAGDVALVVQRTLAASGTGYLGKSWRLNWEDRITRNGSGYSISDSDGKVDFAARGSDFVGPPGQRIMVTPRAGPVRVRGDLSRDGYDDKGRLWWRNFPTAEDFKVQYDQSGKLARIDGPHDAFLKFTYDNGHITRIDSSTGEAVRYEYSSDDLVGVETASAPMVRYSYLNDRLVRIDDPRFGAASFAYDSRRRLTQRLAADGATETWQYDDASGLTRRTDAWGAQITWTRSPDGRHLTRIEANNRRTEVELDAAQRATKVTNPDGGVAQLGYDQLGRLQQVRAGNATPVRLGYFASWAMMVDSALLASVVAPDGTQETVKYNNSGDLVAVTVGDTQVVRRDVSPRDVLLSSAVLGVAEHRFEYDAQGRRTASIDVRGGRTSFEYDARGRLAKRTDPSEASTSFRYDDKNRLTAEIDALGSALQYVYDTAGRMTAKIGRNGSREGYEYDAAGRRIAITDASGRRADVAIDLARRTIVNHFSDGSWRQSVLDPQQHVVSSTDSLGAAEQYSYDDAGRLTGARDRGGRTTKWQYDANGHLTQTDNGLGGIMRYQWTGGTISAVTDAAGAVAKFLADDRGRLGTMIDPTGGRRQYDYDDGDRVLAVRSPGGDMVSFGYDAAGGLGRIWLPSGGVMEYERDAAGRVVKVVHPDGAAFVHEYDVKGNRIATTDPQGRKLKFLYDASGRLAGKSLPESNIAYRYTADGTLVEANDGNFPVQRSLDAKGRVTAVTWPSLGHSLKFAYDDQNRMTQLTGSSGQQIGYKYDEQSRLTAIMLPGNAQIALGYDGGSRLTQVRFPNGVTGAYRYAPTGGIDRLTWNNAGGAALAAWTYHYDPRGNVSAIDHSAGPRIEYKHDADGRLTEEHAGARLAQYGYDASDRTKVTRDGSSASYSYDGDQLATAGGEEFLYDPSGNIVQRKGSAATIQYQYDVEGRLTGAASSQGAKLGFAYDAIGDRVARRDDRGTTYFLNRGDELVEELDEDGNSRALYVYGPGIDHPLAMLRNGKTYFYVADGLGNVALLTDGDGNVAASYETDAFGRLLSPLPALPNPFVFAGREYEAAIGLYYNRARYYDPALGRFLSPDPLIGRPNKVGSYNRYAYALNAPTRYRDPSGLDNTVNNTLPYGPAPPPQDKTINMRSPGGSAAPSTPAPQSSHGYYDEGGLTRPPPDYRLDHEGMERSFGVSKAEQQAMVEFVKEKMQHDPSYVEGGAPAENLLATRHYYNNGVRPSGDQLEADAHYLVERAIGQTLDPGRSSNGPSPAEQAWENLRGTQDPPGWHGGGRQGYEDDLPNSIGDIAEGAEPGPAPGKIVGKPGTAVPSDYVPPNTGDAPAPPPPKPGTPNAGQQGGTPGPAGEGGTAGPAAQQGETPGAGQQGGPPRPGPETGAPPPGTERVASGPPIEAGQQGGPPRPGPETGAPPPGTERVASGPPIEAGTIAPVGNSGAEIGPAFTTLGTEGQIFTWRGQCKAQKPPRFCQDQYCDLEVCRQVHDLKELGGLLSFSRDARARGSGTSYSEAAATDLADLGCLTNKQNYDSCIGSLGPDDLPKPLPPDEQKKNAARKWTKPAQSKPGDCPYAPAPVCLATRMGNTSVPTECAHAKNADMTKPACILADPDSIALSKKNCQYFGGDFRLLSDDEYLTLIGQSQLYWLPANLGGGGGLTLSSSGPGGNCSAKPAARQDVFFPPIKPLRLASLPTPEYGSDSPNHPSGVQPTPEYGSDSPTPVHPQPAPPSPGPQATYDPQSLQPGPGPGPYHPAPAPGPIENGGESTPPVHNQPLVPNKPIIDTEPEHPKPSDAVTPPVHEPPVTNKKITDTWNTQPPVKSGGASENGGYFLPGGISCLGKPGHASCTDQGGHPVNCATDGTCTDSTGRIVNPPATPGPLKPAQLPVKPVQPEPKPLPVQPVTPQQKVAALPVQPVKPDPKPLPVHPVTPEPTLLPVQKVNPQPPLLPVKPVTPQQKVAALPVQPVKPEPKPQVAPEPPVLAKKIDPQPLPVQPPPLPQQIAKVEPPPSCGDALGPIYHPDKRDSVPRTMTDVGGAVCSHTYSPDSGSTLQLTHASIASHPHHGRLTINGLTYTYKPDAGYTGSDHFETDVCGSTDYGSGCSRLIYDVTLE